MNVIPSQNLINLLSSDPSRVVNRVQHQDPSALTTPNFQSILADTFGAVEDTDRVANIHGMELLSGQSDDLSMLMIDIQRAELSLNLAIQIRNRLVEAYQELIRMQV